MVVFSRSPLVRDSHLARTLRKIPILQGHAKKKPPPQLCRSRPQSCLPDWNHGYGPFLAGDVCAETVDLEMDKPDSKGLENIKAIRR